MAKSRKPIAQDLLMDLILSENSKNCNPYILNICLDVAEKLKNKEGETNSESLKNKNDESTLSDKLENMIITIRKENRTAEEKIALLYSKLERIEPDIFKEHDIQDYNILGQSNYSMWEVLEQTTRNKVIISEFFFSKFQQEKKSDYVAVELELAKAIENELNSKVFQRYIDDLLAREKKIDTFLVKDKLNKDLVGRTNKFITQVEKVSYLNSKASLSLEQMSSIFSYVTNVQVVKKSPLLKDFYKYLKNNALDLHLLELDFVEEIAKLSHKYDDVILCPQNVSFEEAKNLKNSFPEKFNFVMKCIV